MYHAGKVDSCDHGCECWVNGLDPLSCSMYELSKCVGTVFQNPRTQFYTVNTTSEIAFGCENHGMEPEEIRKRVMRTADELNMAELLNRNIFQLSGGEKQTALEVLEAMFPSGRITAVVGRNGAGKSTFVSVLCGILKSRKGSIFLNGEKLSCKTRLSMSYMVMQEVNHQLFTDSVEEEVTLGAREFSKGRLEEALSQMDILELKDRHPMTLSGGQKQRVAVAAAMFCGKRVLIFDEPTSGLDFVHMLQTAELLKKIKSQDVFIFVITHDYEFILSACDDVIYIDSGKISGQYRLDKEVLQELQEANVQICIGRGYRQRI